MSFYFPVGPFGPICDLDQPDDIIRRRGRPAQEEDDDDGRIDTFPPLDPDNWLPQFDLFDPPPPWITNRKCKVRTLDDGSLEYYDCIYEYLSDIPDIHYGYSPIFLGSEGMSFCQQSVFLEKKVLLTFCTLSFF